MSESKPKAKKKPKKSALKYEVRKATTQQDYIAIAKYKDTFEKDVGFDKGQIVQAMMSGPAPDRIAAWCVWDQHQRLSGYLIAIDCVLPPMSEAVSILYATTKAGPAASRRVLTQVEEWGRSINAKKVLLQTTKTVKVYERHGFNNTGIAVMEKLL